MRFISQEGSAFIALARREEGGYPCFDISASIDGFTGRNNSVIFTGCGEFIRRLREFDTKRQGMVTLEGTEQCKLTLATFDSSGHMRVDVRLCRYRNQLSGPTTVLTFEGGFVFDAEFANTLFMDMNDLLRGCS